MKYIELGCDIHAKDRIGRTVAHIAAYCGNNYFLSFLFYEKEIDLCSPDDIGNSPLHIAIIRKQEESAILLMKLAQGSINVPGQEGFRPLHLAVAVDDKKIVRHLLINHAFKELKDASFRENYDLVFANHSKDIKKMLVSYK